MKKKEGNGQERKIKRLSDMRTGYHYTSYNNWIRIQQEGLAPYQIDINTTDIPREYRTVNGVWIWESKLNGLSHIGTVIYQMAKRNTTQVVFLKVKYKEEYLWDYGGKIIRSYHTGHIENLEYHSGEKGVISICGIPKKNIELIKVYDLKEIFNQYERTTK